MTADAAFHRQRRQAAAPLVRATLKASDTPTERAENIVALLGHPGDPRVRAEDVAVIADVLAAYQVVDQEARRWVS